MPANCAARISKLGAQQGSSAGDLAQRRGNNRGESLAGLEDIAANISGVLRAGGQVCVYVTAIAVRVGRSEACLSVASTPAIVAGAVVSHVRARVLGAQQREQHVGRFSRRQHHAPRRGPRPAGHGREGGRFLDAVAIVLVDAVGEALE
jgi:hypothetical protein